MIGGLVAEKIDPNIMGRLAAGNPTALTTGTNGKSTTTRMTAAALAELGEVATQVDGANMDAGIIATLRPAAHGAGRRTRGRRVARSARERRRRPEAQMLNLSRDQLDRVGEINMIERRLREGLARHPDTTVIANCDDVLITLPRSTLRRSCGWLRCELGRRLRGAARAPVSRSRAPPATPPTRRFERRRLVFDGRSDVPSSDAPVVGRRRKDLWP